MKIDWLKKTKEKVPFFCSNNYSLFLQNLINSNFSIFKYSVPTCLYLNLFLIPIVHRQKIQASSLSGSGDILSQDKLSQGIYCPGTKRPRDKMSPYLTLFCCSRRGHIVPGDILSQYRKGTYCPRRHIVPVQDTGIFGNIW